jgi:hypothetical protein
MVKALLLLIKIVGIASCALSALMGLAMSPLRYDWDPTIAEPDDDKILVVRSFLIMALLLGTVSAGAMWLTRASNKLGPVFSIQVIAFAICLLLLLAKWI